MKLHWQQEREQLRLRLEGLQAIIGEVLAEVNWGRFDRCDCGHLAAEHKRVISPEAVHDACTVVGCRCIDWDDSEQQFRFDQREAERQPLRAVDEAA